MTTYKTSGMYVTYIGGSYFLGINIQTIIVNERFGNVKDGIRKMVDNSIQRCKEIPIPFTGFVLPKM